MAQKLARPRRPAYSARGETAVQAVRGWELCPGETETTRRGISYVINEPTEPIRRRMTRVGIRRGCPTV